jgi:hypothetical protein
MAKMKCEKGCRLCKLPALKKVWDFVIVANEYPYDRFFRVDHMLITKKHKKHLTPDELVKVDKLKKKLDYDYAFENLPSQASIADHWHIHLFRR